MSTYPGSASPNAPSPVIKQGVQQKLIPGVTYTLTPLNVGYIVYKLRSYDGPFQMEVDGYTFYKFDGSKYDWIMPYSCGDVPYYAFDLMPKNNGRPIYGGPNFGQQDRSSGIKSVAGGTALTTAWTYTVATGRQGLVESMVARIEQNGTTAINSADDYAQIIHKGGNGSVTVVYVDLENTSQNSDRVNSPVFLGPGDQLIAQYAAGSTTEGIYVFLAAIIMETDY